MTRTDWMKTKTRQLLKYSSAAAMTALVACAGLGTPITAVAQHAAKPQGLLGILCPQSPQGPEGSWLYTVTIPGFTTSKGSRPTPPAGATQKPISCPLPRAR
jgi:hypothetical protein